MMNEKVNIVVPVRSLRDGKTRLSSVLSKSDRYELSRRLLINTLSIATSVVGLSSVVVVSRCKDANDIVRSWGVRYLFEVTKGGLNPALSWASQVVSYSGIKRVLVLPFEFVHEPRKGFDAQRWRCRGRRRRGGDLRIEGFLKNFFVELLNALPPLHVFGKGVNTFFTKRLHPLLGVEYVPFRLPNLTLQFLFL